MPWSIASRTLRAVMGFPFLYSWPGDPGAEAAAEHAHRQLGATGAHEPREADDLAGPQSEIRALDQHAAVLGRAVHRPVLDPQNLLADRRLVRRESVLHGAPDHERDELVLVDARVAHRQRLNGAAVADDGRPVGDRRDLVELVRDDHARDALVAQAAQQIEQVSGVVVVQRRGGLVENEELHLLRQRLRDLDELLLADSEVDDLARGFSRSPTRRAARPRARWSRSSRSGRGSRSRCPGRCSRRSRARGTARALDG
jgi:hypothetical protein